MSQRTSRIVGWALKYNPQKVWELNLLSAPGFQSQTRIHERKAY